MAILLQDIPSDGISQEVHQQIQMDRANYRSNLSDMTVFRRYSRGEHDLTLTDKQKEILANVFAEEGVKRFSDNVCHQIIAEARDRVRFNGWSCENTAVKEALDGAYRRSKIRWRQGEIHYDTFRDGDHVIALGWDPVKLRVQLFREPWYDGSTGVFIGYDGEDEPSYGVKDWWEYFLDEKGKPILQLRRNIWFDDRLEKYISEGTARDFIKHYDPEDNGKWPLPWVKRDGSPLHIPYIHFRNTGRGTVNYGTSELEGGVIGFQDQLNDLQWALSGGGRLTAFQMYWIAGIEPTADVQVAAGMVWKIGDANGSAGTLNPGDMSQILAIYDKKLQRVAQISRTPLHAIKGGDWPSGEALLRAEQPAVGKAETQIDGLDVAWTEVGHRYIEILNTYTNAGLPEDTENADIGADFSSPERRDPLSKSIIVNNLGDKISDEQGLRMMEFDNATIEMIVKEKDAKADKDFERQQSAFDRGTAPGTRLPGTGPVEGDE